MTRTVPVLETSRLRLRPLAPHDADAIFAYASDPEATRDVAFRTHHTRQDAVDFIARVACSDGPAAPLVWGITLPPSNDVVGTVGIHDRSPDHDEASIGYIVHPNQQGQGIATEAVRAVVEHVVTQQPDVQMLVARIRHGNGSSVRVVERCGFQPIDKSATRLFAGDGAGSSYHCWRRS